MSNGPDYTKRRIDAHTLYSAHLQEERTLKIYVPPGYEEINSSVRYPVMYCHDGLEFFTHGRVATLANQLLAERKIRPLIIVGVAVQMSTRRDDYGSDGNRHDAYSRFILDEVIPFVERKYNTGTRTEDRFMAGISLGANAALSMYLQRPQFLNQLILFSGAYYEPIVERVKGVSSMADLSAYMVVGQGETDVETPWGASDFYAANHVMRDMLRVRGADVTYTEGPGKHLWGFWQSRIPEALQWLESHRP